MLTSRRGDTWWNKGNLLRHPEREKSKDRAQCHLAEVHTKTSNNVSNIFCTVGMLISGLPDCRSPKRCFCHLLVRGVSIIWECTASTTPGTFTGWWMWLRMDCSSKRVSDRHNWSLSTVRACPLTWTLDNGLVSTWVWVPKGLLANRGKNSGQSIVFVCGGVMRTVYSMEFLGTSGFTSTNERSAKCSGL